jgi:hypothetical protein
LHSQPATGSPGTTQAQPPADPQVADAIQQVIQRANAEQARVIASNDPSVMSDTATGSYYSQLRQTYRDLLAQGATSIQLTNLTWGAITADDSAATANTIETWVTIFSDDTTDQSTDANVYTLVNQGGTWLIQDDQQPTTASPTLQVTPGPAGQPQPTLIRRRSPAVRVPRATGPAMPRPVARIQESAVRGPCPGGGIEWRLGRGCDLGRHWRRKNA